MNNILVLDSLSTFFKMFTQPSLMLSFYKTTVIVIDDADAPSHVIMAFLTPPEDRIHLEAPSP